MLNYQVRFTALASNVLMPYWSHDIGGFSGNHIDTQLYIRWVQFGAVSPFLRLHSDHGDRVPWEYGPEALDAFKKAFGLRMSLAPYIYSTCHQTQVDSIPLVRPMYHEWPRTSTATATTASICSATLCWPARLLFHPRRAALTWMCIFPTGYGSTCTVAREPTEAARSLIAALWTESRCSSGQAGSFRPSPARCRLRSPVRIRWNSRLPRRKRPV